MLLHEVEGNCPDCGSTDVKYGYDQDCSIWKVYGQCDDCGKDFGRIGTISMSNVDHPDEAAEKAEEKAQKFFG